MLQKGVNLAPKGELEKGGWRDYNMSMTSIKLSENGGKAPEAVPYMPAGLNEICCTVNGRAGKRTVMVDAAACERLNADLQEQIKAHQAGGRARPVILFDHKAGAAAAVPTGFEWDEKRGILLKVDWTQAGREAVEGGNYGYISPAFRLAPNSESITGLQDGVEVGSLVNDPAFTRNECIAAAREVVEDVQVYAANPYGCNQHGHEFKAPHGEGWKPRGQSRDSVKEKITEDYENAEKAYREAENKVWEIEDEIAEAYNKDDYEKADKLERKQSILAAEAKKLKAKAKEAKEKWRKATNSDYDAQDLVDLENEQRDKRAEASENSRKIERLSIDLREAEKTAAASRSAKDKKQTEKIRAEWNNAKKKQEELYERLRVIHKIFNPSWELKASYAELDEDLAPFCNIEKSEEAGDNIRAASNGSEKTTGNSDMETVKKMLGLGADATPADVAAAIAALKKKGAEGQKRIEEVEAECNEHKKALHEHKEKAADGFIDRLRKSGKVAHKDEETLKAAREMYMENPERTERIYAAMQPICPAEDGGGDKVQANRVPSGDAAKMSVADFYANMDF